MDSTAITSIIFVINAAYYYTFLNAIIFALIKDSSRPIAADNLMPSTDKIICGAICLIMTLRFFLGNTHYITLMMRDANKGAWVKFYHFMFIWVESFILLLSSYFVPYKIQFVYLTTSLFVAEVVWYMLTMIIDKESVTAEDKINRPSFFRAQMTNIIFVIGVYIVSHRFPAGNRWWLYSIMILFLLNTAYDARKNMRSYMGVV